jgi:ribosomal protein L40E
MAEKTRRGQKQCPKCNAWVKGTRAKACPKCDYQFHAKQRQVHVPQAVLAVVAEKPTKAADTVTIDQVSAVAQTVKVIGGFNRLNELLGLVKEVGGLRKMKALLEAMSVAEAGTTAV